MKILNAHVDPKCRRHIHKSYLLHLIMSQFNQAHKSPYPPYMMLNAEFPPNPTPVLWTVPSPFRKQCSVYSSHFSTPTKHTTLIMTLYSKQPTCQKAPSVLQMRTQA